MGRAHAWAGTPWDTAAFGPGLRRSRRWVWLLACALVCSTAEGWARLPAPRLTKIVRALSNPDLKVRLQAAFVLGKLEDPRTVPALISALNDGYPAIRSLAANALAKIGARRAVPALRRRLTDPHPQVRAHVRSALSDLRLRSKRKDKHRLRFHIGSMAARSALDKPLVGLMPTYWRRAVASTGGATVTDRSRRSAYEISATITRVSEQRRGRTLASTCEVSVIVGKSNGRIVMVGSGGATIEMSNPSRREARRMRSEALERAILSAHRRVVSRLR